MYHLQKNITLRKFSALKNNFAGHISRTHDIKSGFTTFQTPCRVKARKCITSHLSRSTKALSSFSAPLIRRNMDVRRKSFETLRCGIQKIYLLNVINLFKQNFEHSILQRSVEANGIVCSMQAYNSARACSSITYFETRSGRHISPEKTNLVPSDSNDTLHKLPKNVLHNVFDVVAKELNNRDIKLQPSYNIVKGKSNGHSWSCTYNTKWPEAMKFVGVASTKQEASHKAALAALLWLRKVEKITKDGHPIIIDKKQGEKIAKKSIPTLNLDRHTVEEMNKITSIFKDQFVPLLAENLETTEGQDQNLDNYNEAKNVNFRNTKQKCFKKLKYMTREKIKLPISDYKEAFMNLMKENRVVIIKGEPGCGKSTRIPQYLLESWAKEGLDQNEPFSVAVTQPRRIAAISLAERVSNERDENSGQIVGYQVRLKSNFNPTTGRILYCTTGILLRHLQSDLTLSNFTHVILDEAHERDVNTDLLMNLLRATLDVNPKLKLIVMSATIDTTMFKDYFSSASVMHIPGFTYPVKSHFLDNLTSLNLTKTSKMCNDTESPYVVHEDVAKVIKFVHQTKPEGAILCFLPGWEDITKIEKLIPSSNDMNVLRLHSRVNDADQYKIFSKTPPGIRKVILSTNIAETSVTIDDVVYVVDTGIHKENRYDNEKGVGCIDNYWISKSSMIQRKGRAGRVQSGESFHLYKKDKFESFNEFSDPEILKTSLTKIVLDSKVYSNNMDALEFMNRLPTPPEKNATRRAVRELKDLQLLNDNELLTPLGKTLANFQLEPKLAKVLVNAVVYKCVTPVVDIVTIFSADTELFSNSLLDKDSIKQLKVRGCKYSDHLAMMRIFETWLERMEEEGLMSAERYCRDVNLIHHKLITISKLRKIHFDYLHNGLHDSLPIADTYSDNDELVKAILLSGVGTVLKHQDWSIVKGRYKKSNVFLTNYNQKATLTLESVNSKKTSFPSDLLVYFNEVRSNIRRTTVIRESSVISPLAVLLFSDKELTTEELEENKVILNLKNTKIEFSASKEEALAIHTCKEALESAHHYFVFQMTEGGERNKKINVIWDQILGYVNSILSKQSIE